MEDPNTNPNQDDPFHIGNLITIKSTLYGTTTGRVFYRDDDMVRIIPQESSDRAIEFPLDSASQTFRPELGVISVNVLEKTSSDSFVDVIGAQPGEMLEFFNANGEIVMDPELVSSITKTDEDEYITLASGKILRFRGSGLTYDGIGPEPPIVVIRVRSSINAHVDEGEGEEQVEGDVEKEGDIDDSEEMLQMLVSSFRQKATVEYIPVAEQTFPDTMQREEMLAGLMADMTKKQKSNPRRIRFVEREVDVLLSLKRDTIVQNAYGTVTGHVPTIETIQDAVASSADPLPAAIPIVPAARVVNPDLTGAEISYDTSKIYPRMLAQVESGSEHKANMYLDGTAGNEANKLYSYLYDLLGQDQQTLRSAGEGSGSGSEGEGGVWKKDQDILRTAAPEVPVPGFRDLPPAADNKGITIPINIDMLSQTVTDRYMRVLTSDVREATRTRGRVVVAPSDPAKVSAYVLLPISTALTLRPPMNSGNIASALLYSATLERVNQPTLSDILFGETTRLYSDTERTPLQAWTLQAEDVFPISEWLEKALPTAVHPSDSLSTRSPHILSILDTLGIGKRDMSPGVNTIVSNWVESSQILWTNRLAEMKAATQQAIDAGSGERSFYGTDSPLWKSILELQPTEPLGELVADIQQRNETIGQSPSVLTAAFQQEAQGDAAPLVWSKIALIDGREPPVDPVHAANALSASRSYHLLHKTIQNIELLRHKAAPVISTCPHAKTLEAIRNVEEVLKRSRILREFIEQYQGGRNGEWMTCALCKENCVCYHEIMELEALAQPSRLESIKKQILVKYGGERYQGNIICRNCGQSLQDIDYDEHVEFDDDGKPIISRSVLTEEQMANPTESVWRDAVGAAKDVRTFNTEDMNLTASALGTLLNHCGIASIPDPVFRTIVVNTSVFMKAQMPTLATYTKYREGAMKSAATKQDISKGTPQILTYDAIQDQTRITALVSMLALSIQTANPQLEINKQASPCPFGATGWPLDSDKEPKDPSDPKDVGALSYVACVAANITERDRPWSNAPWINMKTMDARPKKALELSVKVMKQILSGQAMYGSIPFTPTLLTTLDKTRQDTAAVLNRALMSKKDVLPHRFRPEAGVEAVSNPVIEKNPLPNVRAAVQSGSVSSDMIQTVAAAVQQMSLATVSELHAAAAASPIQHNAFCCPTTISNVEKGVLQGFHEEGDVARKDLVTARRLLLRSMSDSPNAGSRMWESMEPKTADAAEPSVDEGVFYKLFLKFCYRRSRIGEPHEISVGNTCRRCGLNLGKPLDLIDFNTEGASILASQQGDLRIEATSNLSEMFAGLSDAIRRNKTISVVAPPSAAAAKWKQGLVRLSSYLSSKEAFATIGGALTTVLSQMDAVIQEGVDELALVTLWEPITNLYDGFNAGIAEEIGPLVPAQPGKLREVRAKEAVLALRVFDTLTKEPFVEGPRAIQEYWCSKPFAAGKMYGVKSVNGAKWFKISKEHNAKLNILLDENADWYQGELTDGVWRSILMKVGESLGPLMRIWIQSIRPSETESGSESVWSERAAQSLLRTCIFKIWYDAVSTSSWMYSEIESEDERVEAAAKVANWTRALMLHAKQQSVKYSKEEIALKLQQRAELERTSIVEEFGSGQDDDTRAAALLMKTFRIGRWAIGQNIQKYDPDMYEFESQQRERMGAVEPPVDPTLVPIVEAAGEDFGLGGGGGEEDGYDVVQDTSDDM